MHVCLICVGRTKVWSVYWQYKTHFPLAVGGCRLKDWSLITHDVRNWQWNIEEIPIWSTSTATIHGWDKCSFTSVTNPSNQRTQMKPVLLPCHHWSPNDSLVTCCIKPQCNWKVVSLLMWCSCGTVLKTHGNARRGNEGKRTCPLSVIQLSIINIYIRWQCIATVDWPGLKHLSYLITLREYPNKVKTYLHLSRSQVAFWAFLLPHTACHIEEVSQQSLTVTGRDKIVIPTFFPWSGHPNNTAEVCWEFSKHSI